MDFDHGIGTSNQSRVHIGSDWSTGRSKHSDRHSEFAIGSRAGRLSSEGGGSSGHSSEESESSKYLRRHLDLDDEVDSSKYPIRHLPFDFEITSSGSSRHSDIFPDVMNNRGGNESNPFEISPELFKGWGNDNDYEIRPEVIDGSGSSKRSEVIQEESHRNAGDGVILSTEKLRLSSSSSSSSSSDDADIKLSKSRSGITSTSSPNFDKSLKDEHHVNFSKSEECYNAPADLTWAPQVSSVTHEPTSTKSPPVQVMDRVGEYNPCRIPANVFARNQSTAPADWSTASNDSLFSIQVGNNSFSRDHILNLKSGELLMSGEFIAFSPSIASPVVDTDIKSVQLDHKSKANIVPHDAVKGKTGKTGKTDLTVEKLIYDQPKHPIVSWNSSTNSNHSDDSVTTGHSFAFPIRKTKKDKKKKKQKKCAWPSCYCSNCSWAFCYCARPSCCCCCFRRPKCYCSNSSCAFCYCWNCSINRWCCHNSNDLTDGRNDYCAKEKFEERQQQQQPFATAPSKSSCCCRWTWFRSCKWRWNWCCCCSCSSNCCRCNCC